MYSELCALSFKKFPLCSTVMFHSFLTVLLDTYIKKKKGEAEDRNDYESIIRQLSASLEPKQEGDSRNKKTEYSKEEIVLYVIEECRWDANETKHDLRKFTENAEYIKANYERFIEPLVIALIKEIV